MCNMRNVGKKYIAVVCLVMLIFALTACSRADDKIDGTQWRLLTVQAVKENGAIIAYDPWMVAISSEISADVVSLSLTAENGTLTVKDSTNDRSYSGTYSVTDTTAEATIFAISLGGENGTAVLSDTSYAGGTTVATLILSIGDYVLNFEK